MVGYIIDGRAEFIEPRKLVKLLERERDADPEIYAGIIDAICATAGWSVPMLLKLTNTRIPKYARSADKDEWDVPTFSARAAM